MKRILTLLFAATALLGYGCCDDYDDSALWKDIDGIYKSLNDLKTQVVSMQEQLEALSAIVSSGAVSGITQDADGNYVIRYKDADNVEHTIHVATMSQVNTLPIIGMKQDGGVTYWTTTVNGKTSYVLDIDGKKIPVTGRTPELGVDGEGYWTIFSQRILDAAGKPVRAEGKTASVIVGVEMQDGAIVLTLGNGVKITAQVLNGFDVQMDVDTKVGIEDPTLPLVIHYTLIGETATSVLSIERAEGVAAVLDTKAKTITVTFPSDFEEGRLMVMFYDGADNVVIKPVVFTTLLTEPTGIRSADDLKAFAVAVNAGKSLVKWTIEGEIKLMNDIDMTGIDWNDYVISGKVTPSTTSPNTGVKYALGEQTFNKIFNGDGHTIRNIDWTFDLADGNVSHGLFSALGAEGEIKNLTLEGRIRMKGEAPQGAAVGSVVGYAEGKVTKCTSKVDIAFEGSDAASVSVCQGGVVGYGSNIALTDCTNSGALTCGTIANTANGTNSGFHQGGVIAVMSSGSITGCVNNGNMNAPSGRGGGIVAVATSGTMTSCTNNGTVQDDVAGIFAPNPDYKRMGGLVGGAGDNMVVASCTNNGDVFSQLGCRTGGFIGHNTGKIVKCENKGTILSDHTAIGSNLHGSGWVAGYNKTAESVTECIIGGRVGDWNEYKNDPSKAPAATFGAAIAHGKFSPALNGLSDLMDEYYDWSVVSQSELAPGVTYYHYSMVNFAQHIYVVEADLSNASVMIETVMSDELCLNPNANNNSNNGKNIRETLTETCVRRRAEGRNIVAGINTGFFNSHLGFPRGFHIEYGEPVFINNPTVRQDLPNHRPGFTFFEDRTISFDNRTFSGSVEVGGKEYEFYSVNDTIVQLNWTGYDANIMTSRFKKEPHPGIFNQVGTKALFLVCRGTKPLTVNTGWIDATVTAVVDGRDGSAIEVPFVEERTDWVLQLTGAKAEALASVKAGDPIRIGMEVKIGSEMKPIVTHNASMYRFVNNGKQVAVSDATLMPATCIGADEAGRIVKIVAIDGRTSKNTGMNYNHLARTMLKLGCYNAIRFDGGGSTTMWTWENGAGGVVNDPCDSKGERSCMNYLHVRIK